MTPKFKVSVSIQETQRRSCCIQVCRAVFGMVMLGKVFPLSKSRDNSEGAWILKLLGKGVENCLWGASPGSVVSKMYPAA